MLYTNDAYSALVGKYGAKNVYVLSAGWGLIGSTFLTPQYDITFSQSADAYKRRRKSATYADFCLLSNDCKDDLVLFSGKDYLTLFDELTKAYAGRRHVFYNSSNLTQLAGCNLIRYDTSTRTNWHYECVRAFMNGAVSL